MITPQMVKQLRDVSGAGILDCKEALIEAEGDMARALKILEKKSQAIAAKKGDRETKEGKIDTYLHGEGRIGVLVEVNCETDFVARSDVFKQFVHEICLQIAGMSPKYVSKEDIPQEEIEKMKAGFIEKAVEEGKQRQIAEKIAEGKLDKWFQEHVLLEQPYFRDENKKVKDILTDIIGRCGENIRIRRFVRYEAGEPL